jgi:hypothetical protein
LKLISYPFDVYAGDFYIEVAAFDGLNQATRAVPISISMVNSMSEWSIGINITPVVQNDFSVINADVVMNRGRTQKFFTLFVVIIMWAMSLGVFAMSIAHLWYSREVMPPTIGVVTSMLFALPAVRNTQPGAPPIGCTMDVVGFFWNMGLVAVGAMILLWRFSFQESKVYVPMARAQKNPKPPKETKEFSSVDQAVPIESVMLGGTKVPIRDLADAAYNTFPQTTKRDSVSSITTGGLLQNLRGQKGALRTKGEYNELLGSKDEDFNSVDSQSGDLFYQKKK